MHGGKHAVRLSVQGRRDWETMRYQKNRGVTDVERHQRWKEDGQKERKEGDGDQAKQSQGEVWEGDGRMVTISGGQW